jgi:hypothetical protein
MSREEAIVEALLMVLIIKNIISDNDKNMIKTLTHGLLNESNKDDVIL